MINRYIENEPGQHYTFLLGIIIGGGFRANFDEPPLIAVFCQSCAVAIPRCRSRPGAAYRRGVVSRLVISPWLPEGPLVDRMGSRSMTDGWLG